MAAGGPLERVDDSMKTIIAKLVDGLKFRGEADGEEEEEEDANNNNTNHNITDNNRSNQSDSVQQTDRASFSSDASPSFRRNIQHFTNFESSSSETAMKAYYSNEISSFAAGSERQRRRRHRLRVPPPPASSPPESHTSGASSSGVSSSSSPIGFAFPLTSPASSSSLSSSSSPPATAKTSNNSNLNYNFNQFCSAHLSSTTITMTTSIVSATTTTNTSYSYYSIGHGHLPLPQTPIGLLYPVNFSYAYVAPIAEGLPLMAVDEVMRQQPPLLPQPPGGQSLLATQQQANGTFHPQRASFTGNGRGRGGRNKRCHQVLAPRVPLMGGPPRPSGYYPHHQQEQQQPWALHANYALVGTSQPMMYSLPPTQYVPGYFHYQTANSDVLVSQNQYNPQKHQQTNYHPPAARYYQPNQQRPNSMLYQSLPPGSSVVSPNQYGMYYYCPLVPPTPPPTPKLSKHAATSSEQSDAEQEITRKEKFSNFLLRKSEEQVHEKNESSENEEEKKKEEEVSAPVVEWSSTGSGYTHIQDVIRRNEEWRMEESARKISTEVATSSLSLESYEAEVPVDVEDVAIEPRRSLAMTFSSSSPTGYNKLFPPLPISDHEENSRISQHQSSSETMNLNTSSSIGSFDYRLALLGSQQRSTERTSSGRPKVPTRSVSTFIGYCFTEIHRTLTPPPVRPSSTPADEAYIIDDWYKSPLVSAPTRPWITIKEPKIKTPTTESAGVSAFTVMCYNVLCDKYATRLVYPYTPLWALNWDYRRNKILTEIQHYEADIISLQEVETEQYYNFFHPEMLRIGYDGIFSPKSRAKTMNDADRRHVDGCAIFYKTHKFSLVKEHLIEFNQMAMANAEGCGDMLNRVMTKDNIGLAAILKTKENADKDSALVGNQPLIVSTSHIHWDPEYCDVKLIQTMMFMSELKNFAEEAAQMFGLVKANGGKFDPNSVPVIISGDLNSLPESGVVEFIDKGRISVEHTDFKDFPYRSSLRKLYPNLGIGGSNEYRHVFDLAKAYEDGVMPYTNYTFDFKGIIDYIFCSRATLSVLGILGPIDEEWFHENRVVGCPHQHIPSDHFPLVVELELIPKVISPGLVGDTVDGSASSSSAGGNANGYRR